MVNLGNQELVRELVQRILSSPREAIPFRDYMQQCLYHEKYGYYSSNRVKIGKEGDFYTSSSVGTAMGEMVAAYVAKQADRLISASPKGKLNLVEFGGGNGRLALHIMDALKHRFEAVYASTELAMIETSPYHRSLQQETLAIHAGKANWMTEEEWLENGEKEGTVLIANELLDAFPVHLLEAGPNGELLEVYVGWDDRNEIFIEKLIAISDPGVMAALDADDITLQPDQRVEVCLDAPVWVERVCSHIRNGAIILIDYGDHAARLISPHRMKGTMLAYRRHEASERLYEHIGEQDLTAHVNFSACERAAAKEGASRIELLTQREFLLRHGILELLQDTFDPNPFSPVAKRNRAIRHLLLDDGLGELFKVLLIDKQSSIHEKSGSAM